MTTYYLSFNQGQAGGATNTASVASGTSLPVADVIVIVGGARAVNQLARSTVTQALHAIGNFVRNDPNIPFGLQG